MSNSAITFGINSTISQDGSGAFEIQNNITANVGAGFYSKLSLTNTPVSGTGTVTLSGIISDRSPSQKLTLSQDGTNTVVLTGANTYSGGTVVNAGTLLVNNLAGSGTGRGLVTVNGGTLGGTGTITVAAVEGNAQVNVNSGGTVAPGDGPGQIGALTLNNLQTNFNAGSTLLIDLNATTSDLLSTTSRLTIAPGAMINFNQLAPASAASYTLVTYISVTGAFTFDPMTMPSGYELVYNPHELDLVAVPEPATWVGGIFAVAAIAAAGRRRVFRRLG
ncbi:MAG: autotransporter-associated beta strand repeat-containing protein [Verrucomicrobiota bacterium]|nr:autotransporter-associated beta strand repeat-containing protein [Verrucomicrobiota bacterium]